MVFKVFSPLLDKLLRMSNFLSDPGVIITLVFLIIIILCLLTCFCYQRLAEEAGRSSRDVDLELKKKPREFNSKARHRRSSCSKNVEKRTKVKKDSPDALVKVVDISTSESDDIEDSDDLQTYEQVSDKRKNRKFGHLPKLAARKHLLSSCQSEIDATNFCRERSKIDERNHKFTTINHVFVATAADFEFIFINGVKYHQSKSPVTYYKCQRVGPEDEEWVVLETGIMQPIFNTIKELGHLEVELSEKTRRNRKLSSRSFVINIM